MKRLFLIIGVAALVSALTTLFIHAQLDHSPSRIHHTTTRQAPELVPAARFVNLNNTGNKAHQGYHSNNDATKMPVSAEYPDFRQAAHLSTPAVVYVIAKKEASRPTYSSNYEHLNPFGGYFDSNDPDWLGNDNPFDSRDGSTGSGVIVSKDGYIVTNNHVIANSENIEVTLYDKKTYPAKIIGRDPTTDIALLKIDEFDLPTVNYANSDHVEVGEWVLAVGNPFNLTSTVTAGIVSAKGRNINILTEENAIESFIQTDAVVNPGNSGGALVNIKGQLVGINTAIATPSGTYSGYSFAVPVNIVSKVVDDLLQFGVVQRAFLGADIIDIDSDLAVQYRLKSMRGVFVRYIFEGGSAKEAGLKKGDIITEVNGYPVNDVPELQEKIALYRPGDPVALTYLRNGQPNFIQIILRNKDKGIDLVQKPEETPDLIGADFEELSMTDLSVMGLRHGIRLTELRPGLFKKLTAIKVGFVITHLGDMPIRNVEQFEEFIETFERGKSFNIRGKYLNDKHPTIYPFVLSKE